MQREVFDNVASWLPSSSRSSEPVEIIDTSNHGMQYVKFLFFITSFKLIRLIKHYWKTCVYKSYESFTNFEA